MPFHVSPLTALYDWLWRQPLAMSGGLPVVRLLPDPEPEPVAASDADDEQWAVVCWGYDSPVDHIVVGAFPTEAAAEMWAIEHEPSGEVARLVTPTELLDPGSVAQR